MIAGYVNELYLEFRRNLTLNLGVRYEMSTIPTEIDGKIHYLPTIWSNPTGCTTTPAGDVGSALFAVRPSIQIRLSGILRPHRFAWDPFHDGKTSVRAGFGMFDVLPLPYMLGLNALQTAPDGVEIDLHNPGQGTYPSRLGAIALAQGLPAASNLRWSYVTPDPKRNYVMQWNLNIQRQLTGSTALNNRLCWFTRAQ